MDDAQLQLIYRAVVIAKLAYASSSWWGFTSASDRQRLEGFLRRGRRYGLYPADQTDRRQIKASLNARLLITNYKRYITLGRGRQWVRSSPPNALSQQQQKTLTDIPRNCVHTFAACICTCIRCCTRCSRRPAVGLISFNSVVF